MKGEEDKRNAHVCSGGGHPEGHEGLLEVDRLYGKVNRNGGIVMSVDGLASSCQWIEGCDLRSSCAFEERFLKSELEDKSLCEGAWTTFHTFMHLCIKVLIFTSRVSSKYSTELF